MAKVSDSDIKIEVEDGKVDILMTSTTPGYPLSGGFRRDGPPRSRISRRRHQGRSRTNIRTQLDTKQNEQQSQRRSRPPNRHDRILTIF